MELLTVKNLSFCYPECDTPVWENLSFQIPQGSFTVLCGATGSGKSTLLRLLKKELSPLGTQRGDIFICGKKTESLSARESASLIGFVMQKPEQQIVTDRVWHELVFGLENLGVSQNEMQHRVAEIAGYFGITEWYDKPVSELSGGQKQLLNLASVLVMQPKLLILDEPTAQLDPIATTEFFSTLKKLNEDLGLTILISEHRLEEVIPLCHQLMVLEKGALMINDTPQKAIPLLKNHPNIFSAMPMASRLFLNFSQKGKLPITIREGREYLHTCHKNQIRSLESPSCKEKAETVLEFRDICFRYEPKGRDILKHLNLQVHKGEILCILGGNASGKSTLLKNASALLKPYSGKIFLFGKEIKHYKGQSLYQNCLALLPQDVQTCFLHNTVREELESVKIDPSALPFDLSHLLHQHPYDLSGGEQQLTALAKILHANPKILLMDEPTKALDTHAKEQLISVLQNLKKQDVTIIMVTHDPDFASECADRCAMFFEGNMVAMGTPRDFFSHNTFYTTSISKITRGFFDNAVTFQDAVMLCEKNQKRISEHDTDCK